ncbi:hypothetical protein [Amycolatopsis taiwanensis]|uniref:hypothetical protein n=1 Tax=Amycolatopsis taiwanensis TaxID=342230 RepID=UPI0012EC059C|nr:hypothetical protein [Amycolatopsis taiwanensis]
MRLMLGYQNLAQRRSEPPCFDVREPNEAAIGQVDLDDLVCSPTQVQRNPLPVPVTADDFAVVPAQSPQQGLSGHGTSRGLHCTGLFLAARQASRALVARGSIGLGARLCASR